MAKYNEAVLGELHIRFSLIIKKVFITTRSHPLPPVKNSEEHDINVLSDIFKSYLYFENIG